MYTAGNIPNSRSEKLDLGSPSSHVILGNIIVTILYAVVISLHRPHYYYTGIYAYNIIYIVIQCSQLAAGVAAISIVSAHLLF